MEKPTVGFVCFGEVNTPIERLKLKHDEALKSISGLCGTIYDGGIVTDEPGYASSKRAIEILKKSQATTEFSSLIICVAGWVPSHAVIFVTDVFRHIPMLLWGLNGWYENGKLFSTADQAGTSALRPAFEEMGYKFKYIYSIAGKPHPIESIGAFISAGHAYYKLRTARIGTMGWRDMLLYGTCADPAAIRSRFGVEIEPFELLEVARDADKVNEEEVSRMLSFMKEKWTFIEPYDECVLQTGARYALAIGTKIEERGYEALSLIDVDGMKKLIKFPPAMIFMLLDHYYDVQLLPENDLIGGVTQIILKYLTGQNTFYLEYYEFFENSVLAGVPDFIPETATYGDIKVQTTAFGNLNSSLLNVSEVKPGALTCARLAYICGRFRLHLYTADGRQPPSWAEYGWDEPAPKLPSLELFPDSCTVPQLAERILSQHVLCSYGNHTAALNDLCKLLDIEVC